MLAAVSLSLFSASAFLQNAGYHGRPATKLSASRWASTATMQETKASISADADAVFDVIDQDGDGRVSLDELVQHLTKSGYKQDAVESIFKRLDLNKDGELSKDELRAGFVQYSPLRSAPGLGSYNEQFVEEIYADATSLFNSIDIDGDGEITDPELRLHLRSFSGYSDAAISNIFALLDVDDDGSITQDELKDAFVKYSALRLAIGEGPNFK